MATAADIRARVTSVCATNGYTLAAVTGCDRLRDAAASVYMTGSFWCGAASMAAAVASRRADSASEAADSNVPDCAPCSLSTP